MLSTTTRTDCNQDESKTTLADAIRVEPEFAGLGPPLSGEEEAALERSLLAEGCRDPLVLWKEQGILLDGHNRLRLCLRHDILFRTVTLAFASREEAREWILANQRARRNLTPEGISYLRGKHYLAAKHQGKPDGAASGQIVQKTTTAQKLAEWYHVDEKTIRRDAGFSQDVDTLAANCGEEVKRLILARGARLSRADVSRLRLLGKDDQQRAVQEILESGTSRKWKPEQGSMRISVPIEPEALAQALLRRLGRERADATCRALLVALSEADATEPGETSLAQARRA